MTLNFQRPTGATVTVLGSGHHGTTPTLLFSFYRAAQYTGERKILRQVFFNVGENTERICMNHSGVKLKQTGTVIATRWVTLSEFVFGLCCFEASVGYPFNLFLPIVVVINHFECHALKSMPFGHWSYPSLHSRCHSTLTSAAAK